MQVGLADAEVRIQNLFDSNVRERQAALAGSRPRKQRLPAAGRSEEQHPSACAAVVLLVQVVTLEREDDRSVDRLLHVVEAADIGEGNGRLRVELELWLFSKPALVDALLHDTDELLQPQRLVQLLLQLGDAVDCSSRACSVDERLRSVMSAGCKSRPPAGDEPVLVQLLLGEQQLVLC